MDTKTKRLQKDFDALYDEMTELMLRMRELINSVQQPSGFLISPIDAAITADLEWQRANALMMSIDNRSI